MTFEIPVRSDFPAFSFQIDLEEIPFTLTFQFNDRIERWVMDIGDEEGVDILTGIPVHTGVPLIDEFVKDKLPPGEFIAVDETGMDRDAGRNDLGNEVKLLYVES